VKRFFYTYWSDILMCLFVGGLLAICAYCSANK